MMLYTMNYKNAQTTRSIDSPVLPPSDQVRILHQIAIDVLHMITEHNRTQPKTRFWINDTC